MHGLRNIFTRRLKCAALRVLATAIVIMAGCGSVAQAGFDFTVGETFRSYPLSGVLEVDSGYGFLLWGARTPTSPWYGYLRPRVIASTAGTYNSLDGAVEFYPLSFLGGRVGAEGVENNRDYSAYDCVTFVCRGRFYRTYASADLTLGAGPLFAQFRWRRERWTQRTPGVVPFIDPTNALALSGQGDFETIYRAMLGASLNPRWALMGVLVYAAADSNRAISRFPFALLRYRAGFWTIAAGGGSYRSALQREEASGLLFISWEPKPSVALN